MTSIEARGPCAVAALLWRRAGAVRLTAVAKARYRIVADSDLVEPEPAAVGASEVYQSGNPMRSVVAPIDLSPSPQRAEVLVIGAAFAPDGKPAPHVGVRLGISRGSQLLVDKVLDVVGDRAQALERPEPFARMPITWERAFGGMGYADNPAGCGASGGPQPNVFASDRSKPAGIAPLSTLWGEHRRLLGGAALPRIGAGVVEIDERIDPRFFHAAPEDQRFDGLEGGEWLLLGNMHPRHAILRLRLPAIAAEASARTGAGSRTSTMRVERLLVEPEAGHCTLTCRATFDLPADGKVDGLTITWPGAKLRDGAKTLAVVPGADRAHALPFDPSAAPSPPAADPPPRAARGRTAGTMGITDDYEPEAALPFGAGGAPRPAPPQARSVKATIGIDDAEQADAAVRAPIPFAGVAAPPSDRPSNGPVPGAPWAGAAARAPRARPDMVATIADDPAEAPESAKEEPKRAAPRREELYRDEQAVGPRADLRPVPRAPAKPVRRAMKNDVYKGFKPRGRS